MSSKRHTPAEVKSIIAERVPVGLVVSEHTDSEHWYRHTPSGVLLPSVTTITGVLQAPHLKMWSANMALDYLEEHAAEIEPGVNIPIELRKAAIMAHEDVFHDAGDIGTQGHGIIEDYLKVWLETGLQPADITSFITGEDHRLWAITRSAQKVFNAYYAIPVASELKVAYVPKNKPEKGFAGTLDALMMFAFPEVEGSKKCEHVVHLVAGRWDRLGCMECGARWQYHFTLVDFKTSNSIQNKTEYYMQTSAYWKAIKVLLGIAPTRVVIVRLDKHQEKYEILEVLKPVKAFSAFAQLKNVYDFLKLPESKKSLQIERNERVSIDDL